MSEIAPRIDCFVTFGQQYRHEPHPEWPPAHPDGWLRVTGYTYSQARAVAFAITAGKHAFDYRAEEDFNPSWYPLGELAHIDVTTAAIRGQQ